MAARSDSITIIRAKLHRPPVAADYVRRKTLTERLRQGRALPFTLVAAPTGYGKSMLISHWLESSNLAHAWVSLDETESDLSIFTAYFVAAVRSVWPEACPATSRWLQSGPLHDAQPLAASLSNDLDAIDGPFVLVLDDYHHIRDPAVHDLLDHLLEHPPQSFQLVIISRRDPPLSLARFRARRQMTDIRMRDLQFTEKETAAFLRRAVGRRLDPSVVERLHDRTEGWPAALRLAALALLQQRDAEEFLRGFTGDSQQLQEYMVAELLDHEPPEVSECLCRTSILDRFCQPLCQALCETRCGSDRCTVQQRMANHAAASEGLLCVPLDERGEWFRYHHLFQELLQRRLREQLSPNEIAELHRRAAAWLEQHGELDEAVQHALRGGGPDEAARLIARHRDKILSNEQWLRVDQWLRWLPPNAGQDDPGFLTLKAWFLENRCRYAEMYAVLDRIERLLNSQKETDAENSRVRAELDALRSYQCYAEGDSEQAVVLAERALTQLSAECSNQRGFAVILLAAAHQMAGRLDQARRVVYEALSQEPPARRSAYHTRLLCSLCFVNWMAADLPALKRTATQCLEMSEQLGLAESSQVGRYFVGIVHYQLNELSEAEAALRPVVNDAAVPRMEYFAHSSFALASVLEATGRSDEAQRTAEFITDFLLKARNTDLLRVAQAYQAELAWRQGRLAEAQRWADEYIPEPLTPLYQFYAPQLTLAKILIAQDCPASRAQVEQLLKRLAAYLAKIHNVRFLIETHALQAMLHQAGGEMVEATERLRRAVALALPGGLIRVFLDLGPRLAELMKQATWDETARPHVARVIAAFQTPSAVAELPERSETGPTAHQSPELISAPLTKREQEIIRMLAERLSNKEIAARLHISPATVKRHLENIYSKLRSHGRRDAVEKARALGFLSRF